MKTIRDIFVKSLIFLSKKRLIIFNDQLYLELIYLLQFSKNLNLKNPQTFNEKLQWLKLHDRNPKYTKMVDKYEAKKYVASKIGKEYIIPTLGVYDKFNDIDFDKLPNQFVIKCTHDSGGLVICKDKTKLDIKKVRKKINKCLKTNYYYAGREWPYKNVKPRIIIEKYMVDEKINELLDYKFFCFNGKMKIFKIDFDRYTNHGANYYSRENKLLPFEESKYPQNKNKNISFPKNLKKMIKLAELLSHDIPFLRVDFYEINSQVYFGELTFYPASGFGIINPLYWDYELGKYLKLPNKE